MAAGLQLEREQPFGSWAAARARTAFRRTGFVVRFEARSRRTARPQVRRTADLRIIATKPQISGHVGLDH
eukprot:5261319-Prymnesium_polylepis.1